MSRPQAGRWRRARPGIRSIGPGRGLERPCAKRETKLPKWRRASRGAADWRYSFGRPWIERYILIFEGHGSLCTPLMDIEFQRPVAPGGLQVARSLRKRRHLDDVTPRGSHAKPAKPLREFFARDKCF